jgi:hypothetical protein
LKKAEAISMDLLNLILNYIFCLIAPIGLLVMCAILGIKSRQRYIAQILQKKREGGFEKWDKPPISTRLRKIILIEISAFFLIVVWGVLLLYKSKIATSWLVLALVGSAVIIFIVESVQIGKMLTNQELK